MERFRRDKAKSCRAIQLYDCEYNSNNVLDDLLAKKVLKTNKNTVVAIPDLLVPIESVMARMTIDMDIPTAPNSINWE